MQNLFTALLLTVGLAAPAAVRAQSAVTFGPRLGLNVTTFSYGGTPSQLNETKSMVGVQVGGTANIRLGDGNLAFQPSLLFTQKGAELRGTGSSPNPGTPFNYSITASPKLGFIELPLNVVYTFGGQNGFQLFAGPYVALGVGGSGSYRVTFSSTDPNLAAFSGDYPGDLVVEYGSTQNPNDNLQNSNSFGAPSLTLTFRRFDAGFNGGVGYRVGPFQAQLGYGLGLVNFVPRDPDGNDSGSKGYHRGFQLAANYFFGGQ